MFTVLILSFRTDRSGQTVQTQIRLLEKQSDQGLHCLQFCLHLLDVLLMVKPLCSNFRVITANSSGVRIFRIFTVIFQEYDNRLKDMQRQYEEEKVSKVRLQQDMQKLRAFYDEKLTSVEGELEKIPTTAEGNDKSFHRCVAV